MTRKSRVRAPAPAGSHSLQCPRVPSCPTWSVFIWSPKRRPLCQSVAQWRHTARYGSRAPVLFRKLECFGMRHCARLSLRGGAHHLGWLVAKNQRHRRPAACCQRIRNLPSHSLRRLQSSARCRWQHYLRMSTALSQLFASCRCQSIPGDRRARNLGRGTHRFRLFPPLIR